MIKFDVITIFPDQILTFAKEGVFRIAEKNRLVEIKVHNLRDWSNNKHKQVDDRPYGGGAGMVLMIEPIFKALAQLKTENSKVIVTSPVGQKLTQKLLRELSGTDSNAESIDGNRSKVFSDLHYIIICGHYEGFDERIKQNLIDIDISVGDYVLSGGELPALIIMDGIIRLIPGVLGNELSAQTESFENGKFDFPVWTRPAEFNGWKVPDVMLEGHHKKISEYRDKVTKLVRPK